jgi:hypothetical protein
MIGVIAKKQIERMTFHYTAIDGKLKQLRCSSSINSIPPRNSRVAPYDQV